MPKLTAPWIRPSGRYYAKPRSNWQMLKLRRGVAIIALAIATNLHAAPEPTISIQIELTSAQRRNEQRYGSVEVVFVYISDDLEEVSKRHRTAYLSGENTYRFPQNFDGMLVAVDVFLLTSSQVAGESGGNRESILEGHVVMDDLLAWIPGTQIVVPMSSTVVVEDASEVSESSMLDMFRNADGNRDGAVTGTEIDQLAAMKARRWHKASDRNADAVLDQEEFAEWICPFLFRLRDINKNGTLSYGEYCALAQAVYFPTPENFDSSNPAHLKKFEEQQLLQSFWHVSSLGVSGVPVYTTAAPAVRAHGNNPLVASFPETGFMDIRWFLLKMQSNRNRQRNACYFGFLRFSGAPESGLNVEQFGAALAKVLRAIHAFADTNHDGRVDHAEIEALELPFVHIDGELASSWNGTITYEGLSLGPHAVLRFSRDIEIRAKSLKVAKGAEIRVSGRSADDNLPIGLKGPNVTVIAVFDGNAGNLVIKSIGGDGKDGKQGSEGQAGALNPGPGGGGQDGTDAGDGGDILIHWASRRVTDTHKPDAQSVGGAGGKGGAGGPGGKLTGWVAGANGPPGDPGNDGDDGDVGEVEIVKYEPAELLPALGY